MPSYFSAPGVLAPTGSASGVTHAAYKVNPEAASLAVQFVVEAVGGTPTVTYKVQGSPDNVNWYDWLYVTDITDTGAVATRAATAVGAQIEWLSNAVVRTYQYVRVVTSANTNVTYRAELYETVIV